MGIESSVALVQVTRQQKADVVVELVALKVMGIPSSASVGERNTSALKLTWSNRRPLEPHAHAARLHAHGYGHACVRVHLLLHQMRSATGRLPNGRNGATL